MERKKTILDKALQSIAKKVVDCEVRGWPPICSGFSYQPVRPHDNQKEVNKEVAIR